MAEFEVEIEVDKLQGIDYIKQLENLRQRLAWLIIPDTNPPLHVLAPSPEQAHTYRWFDMILKSKSYNSSLRLRLRVEDLYLDGFQKDGSDEWFEFGQHPKPHLIPNSTFLGITGSYTDLESRRGYGKWRKNLALGKCNLVDAIINLADNDEKVVFKVRCKFLLVVIQMICEATRFSYISDLLANTFNNDGGYDTLFPSIQMLSLENNWGSLSLWLLRCHEQNQYLPYEPHPNDMEIATHMDGINVMGIAKKVRKREKGVGGAIGEPLVEVSQVIWIPMNDIRDLYGSIKISDGIGSEYLFNRSRETPVRTSPGKRLLLTGPNRCISASDSFSFDVNLKDAANDPTDDDDDDTVETISWNVYDIVALRCITGICKRLLRKTLVGFM